MKYIDMKMRRKFDENNSIIVHEDRKLKQILYLKLCLLFCLENKFGHEITFY